MKSLLFGVSETDPADLCGNHFGVDVGCFDCVLHTGEKSNESGSVGGASIRVSGTDFSLCWLVEVKEGTVNS